MAAEVTPYETGGGEPLQDWMIAVIAGVAGVLLLAIVVLALCCFKCRKKARGGKNILTLTVSSVLKLLPNLHPNVLFQYKVYLFVQLQVCFY